MTNFIVLGHIWTDRGVTKATKIKLVRTLIFPIATYACETWTINNADQDRINAFMHLSFGVGGECCESPGQLNGPTSASLKKLAPKGS